MKIKKISWEYLWYEWIKPMIIAAVLAVFIRTFFVQPFKIPSSSMYPTLRSGDRIFVNKLVYGPRVPFTGIRLPGIREPHLGDIVVFLSPAEKKKYLVKRFIAGPGDSLQIIDGRLFLNGKETDKGVFKELFYYNRGDYGAENKLIHVPEGRFFVLGDNSANSLDSRYWGFVPQDNLVGRAFLIHWPIRRIQLLREGD